MDAERFDHLTRKLGSGYSRRRAVVALGTLAALWAQRGRAAQLGLPACGSAGAVCTMLAGCCDGLTCVTSAINTNYGVCVSGGNGGTVASGTSLMSPFGGSTQASTAVDTPTADTTTTSETTTTATDPRAEREARLQERRSRRSARRTKIQSRRNTKATSRKTRREESAEAAVLAAGPELEFDYFVKQLNAGGLTESYEELSITNASDYSALLTAVRLYESASSGTSLSRTIASGASFGLVSGLPNGDGLGSDQYWWLNLDVCVGKQDTAAHGWIVKAAFSGEVENRTYTVLCDGSVNGVPSTAQPVTNNKRKKRRRKQQVAARRKNRKQNKKDR